MSYILGIESSCDDTAAAVVNRDGQVLSSVIVSQNDIHNNFGGVYPEFASRAHIYNVLPVVHQALEESGIDKTDLQAIGVTRGPGLVGSLLIGVNTAQALGAGWQIPVVGVNHLRGHLRSAELEGHPVAYPAVVLLVSGGHTLLAYMKSRVDIELLGETRDDSVGESFDKVGRMLELDFPAGPMVDRMAQAGRVTVEFPRPLLHEGYEFSFSGLKTSVSRCLEAGQESSVENLCASFIEAIAEVLIYKSRKALRQTRAVSLVIVGGVAANSQLRARAVELCAQEKVSLALPPVKWSTDNAAMIALATWDYLDQGVYPELTPLSRLPLFAY